MLQTVFTGPTNYANPMVLVRKKAKTCGGVLYGIVLGRVLALPGCNANWPAPGSKEEAELLAHYHPFPPRS
jgi:hypothetical protein